ncbi:hypothetical protein PHYSODRAFT_341816 [Phytophthora sojae]|uniref:Uncharacterized protein n=1 Tax=Phytophthora sojae (strain P6497) TaxID=1094619 RepID=G5AEG4_PHYSP|nr:hypothetical protein PHYSODRAFT_341816 [Phytophthora sojae]EGZ06566.1 hypothetical protein PHYSODRAFT_341816 [Phytophthora sojae]|eukprot:XP_009538463.1 hypothetical protein PHYSODRAFT_341816 [Phytophthora sojae]
MVPRPGSTTSNDGLTIQEASEAGARSAGRSPTAGEHSERPVASWSSEGTFTTGHGASDDQEGYEEQFAVLDAAPSSGAARGRDASRGPTGRTYVALFVQDGALVDSSDDYASSWTLSLCLAAHHPRRLSVDLCRASPPSIASRFINCVEFIIRIHQHSSRRLLSPTPTCPLPRWVLHHIRPAATHAHSPGGCVVAEPAPRVGRISIRRILCRLRPLRCHSSIMVRAEDFCVEESGPDTGNLEAALTSSSMQAVHIGLASLIRPISSR